MFKNVILALDGSPYAHTVLDYGKYLSEQFHSFLNLMHVIDIRMYEWTVSVGMDGFSTVMPSASFQEESQSLLETRAKEIMEKASNYCKEIQIEYKEILEHGSPVELISDRCRLTDLLVLGVRGEYAKWSKKFLGMVTEAVSRECSKPMLFVQNQFKPFKKILLAYDGSEHASHALSYAAFVGEKLQIPIVIVSSHHDRAIAIELMKEAGTYLQPYKVLIEEVIKAGHPDKDIIEVQHEKECDLIIMGAYGHSRIREALIGSVTIQVLRNSEVPILLVK